MEMNGWASLISNLGFPIVVTMILLFRVDSSINRLDRTIDVLTTVIAKSSGVDKEEARELAGCMKGGKD